METLEKSIVANREVCLHRAISIQSRAISLLWDLENSFITKEERNSIRNERYDLSLQRKVMKVEPEQNIESENHLSLHSNPLEIDTALEITDFVRSKVLKQEKVQSISQSSSHSSISMMAASLLQ